MAYKVIDLNEHNGSVNFKALDIDAVILRVGYRGYAPEGYLKIDNKFKSYIKSCNKYHIPVGVYFFSQATSIAEAKAEAKFVLRNISDYRVDLPVYFNIEYAENNKGFTGRLYNKQISKEKQTRIAKAFCDTILINGYEAGVLSNYDFFRIKLIAEQLNNYSLWISYYSAKGVPTVAGANFDMWQYTDDAEVKGVTGMVAVDCLYKDFIWCKYVTTADLNYRSSANLHLKDYSGTLAEGIVVDVLAGSEINSDGYEWVKIRLDDKMYYAVKQYLRRV